MKLNSLEEAESWLGKSLSDAFDRPFFMLNAKDINWVMFHLDTMSGDDSSRSVANLIGFELEEEAWERNDCGF